MRDPVCGMIVSEEKIAGGYSYRHHRRSYALQFGIGGGNAQRLHRARL